MKRGKAPGLDKVPAELLQSSGEAGLAMITDLLNMAFTTQTLPTQWRVGSVVPVFKKGDRSECGNYRPITLLRTLDKLYASTLSRRLEKALQEHPDQYGFCRHKGTAEAHFNLISAVEQAFASGDPLYFLSLDIRKAFDEVSRPLMLTNLYERGVRGRLWHAIRVLYERTEAAVSVAGATSTPFAVDKGVAQGCPLSPKLFNTHVLAILEALDSVAQLHGVLIPGSHPGSTTPKYSIGEMFADDLAAWSRAKQGVEAAAEGAKQAAHGRHLDTAANKDVFMVFRSTPLANNEPEDPLHLSGHDIAASQTHKHLGLHLLPNLDWTAQINAAISNGSHGLYSFARDLANPHLDMGPKRLIVQTHILSRMKFGMENWYPNSAAARAAFCKAEKVLIKALHCALGLHHTRRNLIYTRMLKADVLMADLGIPSLTTENVAALIRFAYKHDPSGSFAACPGAGDDEVGPALAALASALHTAALERERRRGVAAKQGIQGDAAAMEQAPEKPPSNLAIKASLHEQCLDQCFEANVPQSQLGAQERQATHGYNTRHSAGHRD